MLKTLLSEPSFENKSRKYEKWPASEYSKNKTLMIRVPKVIKHFPQQIFNVNRHILKQEILNILLESH